jgi:hypothetical protein
MSSQEVLKHTVVSDTWFTVITTVLGLLVSYVVGNAIYQCYLSPLAKFPGPKLAAATRLYEVYYDVFKWGRYTFEIKEMHKKYGERSWDHNTRKEVE